MFYLYISLALIAIYIVLCIIQKLTGVQSAGKKALIGMSCGVLAIVLVNLSSGFTGISLPVSLLSLGIAATGGIPAVSLMLLLNIII